MGRPRPRDGGSSDKEAFVYTQEALRPTEGLRTTPADFSAVTSLMTEEESRFSDAPLYSPEDVGVGILALGLLLSPKSPKPSKDR